MLLSHGFSLTSEMWDQQLPFFSAQNQVVTWDMRGHGDSSYPESPSDYSEDLAVSDMAALLDTVGADTAIIGGLSLGGYLSLSFYAAHPERCRALMLFDTGPGFRRDDARAQWNERCRKQGDRLEADGLRETHYPGTHRNAIGLAHVAREMMTQSDDRVMRILPEIKVPVLIVLGANDTPFLGAANYMEKKIPNATKVVIPDAGHVSNVDQPEAFTAAVQDFLTKL